MVENNRYQYVNYQNANSNKKSIKHGVAQVSIHGPLLFIIYISDLESIILIRPTNINAELNLNIGRLNTELVSISDWLDWLKINQPSLRASFSKIHALYH